MDNIIKHQLPKALLTLSFAGLIVGCSTQSVSIPGSQLIGQQKSNKCTNKKSGKMIPGCGAEKATHKGKREPLRLLAEKPKTPPVTRTTIITAEKVPVAASKPVPTVGVVATEAKLPKPVITTPVVAKPVTPKPAPIATKVAVIPKPKPAMVQTETTRRLTLSGSTNFKTGSATLNQAGKDKLASLARSLTSQNTTLTRLLIEGHTDSVGAAAFNQVLSLKRANAVADYLSTQGLMRSSMETVGKGESSPIADNTTKTGRAQNRRVEITATGTRLTKR